MFSLIFPMAVSITILLLYVVIAAFLLRKYLRTRDIGFIWLGIAVVIWPLLTRWSYFALYQHYIHGPHTGLYQGISVLGARMSFWAFLHSLDELEQLIGLALILVSVACLSRSNIKPAIEN